MSAGEARVESIQALRATAALSVIGFHFHQVGHRYVGPGAFLPDWFNLGVTGVDLFFVISGFVMVMVTRGRFGRLKEAIRFAWFRISRIYPVYWLYFALTLAVFLAKPLSADVSDAGERKCDLLSSFFLLPTGHRPLVEVSWSLIHEIWFYLVFSLLLLWRERWLPLLLLCWAGVVAAANSTRDVEAMGPGLHIALHPLTFEFLLGASAALLTSISAVRKAPAPLLWGIIVAVMVLGLPEVVRHEQSLEESDPIRVAILGPLYAALVAAMMLLEQRRHIKVPRLFRSMGDASYTAYLSHPLVIGLLGQLWILLHQGNASTAGGFALWPVMTIAVLVYAWLGYRFIEKPVVDLSHRLWRKAAALASRRNQGAPLTTPAASAQRPDPLSASADCSRQRS